MNRLVLIDKGQVQITDHLMDQATDPFQVTQLRALSACHVLDLLDEDTTRT
jgi:hypothetical protein